MRSRSRYGCLTCRIRRVKCDENRPECMKCRQTGRKCEGPPSEDLIFKHHAPKVRIKALKINLRATPSPSPLFVSSDEFRAFDFFLSCASSALDSTGLDAYFWATILPQLSHANPAIQHAVLAISGLFEHPLPLRYTHSHEKTEQQLQALEWYNQSVSSIISLSQLPNSHDQTEMQTLITSCILFASIEMQQAHVVNTMHLLKNGFSLIRTYLSIHAGKAPEWIRKILFPMFIRQLVLLAVHGYRPPVEWYDIADRLLPQNQSTPLRSLSEARNRLFALLHLCFELIHDATPYPTTPAHKSALRKRQRDLLFNLASWRSNTLDLHASSTLDTNSTLNQAKRLATHNTLLADACIAQIWVSTCLNHHYPPHQQVPSDIHSSTFTLALDHAEAALSQNCSPSSSSLHSLPSPLPTCSAIPFTFDMSLLPILYFVGWKCRTSHLRHRALSLLRRSAVHCKQESLFVAELQIRGLEAILRLEEEGALVLNNIGPGNVGDAGAGDMKGKDRRLHNVVLHWENLAGEQTQPKLLFSREVSEGDGIVMRKGEVVI